MKFITKNNNIYFTQFPLYELNDTAKSDFVQLIYFVYCSIYFRVNYWTSIYFTLDRGK